MPSTPDKLNPLPWRKACVYEREEKASGRRLRKWHIIDANGFEVCAMFYITPETEQTVDFLIERVNAAYAEEGREAVSRNGVPVDRPDAGHRSASTNGSK
jgi:hypothetical protein